MLSCSSKYEGTLNGFAYLYPFTRKCIFNKNSNRCEMIRLQNRLLNMSENRVNEKVFLWSKLNNSPQVKEIHHIAEEAELQYMYRNNLKG